MRNMLPALMLLSSAALAGPAAQLRFGLSSAPTSPEKAAGQAKAIEPYLSKALARPVSVTVNPTFEGLATDLAEGKLDAAWMPPFTFVRAASQNPKIQPLAKAIRNGAPLYISVLFSRAAKNPLTLGDFKGKKVAWVDPASTSGYLFPLAMLKEQGIDAGAWFKEQATLGSHAAVCKAVAGGKYDLGATFSDVPAEGGQLALDGCRGHTDIKKLAVVDVAGTVPNDVIAVRADLDPEDVKRVKQAVLGLSDNKDGAALLKVVFEADGFEGSDVGDFDSVRKAWLALQAAPAAPAASPAKP